MPTTRTFIDQISIQNFKFFPKLEKPIEVNGKHLLIYGENGSGKSSIYWALYTLLECANKDDDTQIKKYFNPTDNERLTNIHMTPGSASWVDPFIQVTLKDGSNPFYVSFANTNINQNKEAQESNFSSDFINYRSLLSLYNFAHSEDINLFSFFTYAILPYVKFAPVTYWHEKKDKTIIQFTTESANRIWDFVFKGPQRNIPNRQGHPRFPQGIEQEIIDYRNLVTGFKTSLQDLITFINTEGNPILKEDLGYNLTFKLELIEHPVYKGSRKRRDPFLLTQQKFEPPRYTIKFDITEYEGVPNAVKRPHSFLNEARLTAVGLAIRLAVLKRTTSEDAKLKLLALDDLLISLDMSNRQKVLDLLLEKYQKDYQIVVLTHDRSFYEVTKSKIKNAGFDKQWLFYEMYHDESKLYQDNTPAPIKPIIFRSPQKIKKAEEFIALHDYPAAGIYLRNSCEEQLDDLYPDFFKYETKANNEGNLETVSLNLNDKILKLKEFCLKENINYEPFKDLKIYKDCFLNVIAHNDKTEPLYKIELTAVLNALKELNKIKRSRHIIKSNKDLLFDLADGNGNTFHCAVRLKGNLTLLEEEGKAPVLSYYNQCEVRKTVANGVENTEPFSESSLTAYYRKKCTDLGIQANHDLFQLFRYQGNPIQQKLDELLNN